MRREMTRPRRRLSRRRPRPAPGRSRPSPPLQSSSGRVECRLQLRPGHEATNRHVARYPQLPQVRRHGTHGDSDQGHVDHLRHIRLVRRIRRPRGRRFELGESTLVCSNAPPVSPTVSGTSGAASRRRGRRSTSPHSCPATALSRSPSPAGRPRRSPSRAVRWRPRHHNSRSPRRDRPAVSPLGTVATLAAIATACGSSEAAPKLVGAPALRRPLARGFTFRDQAGRQVSLSDSRGRWCFSASCTPTARTCAR